VTLTTNKPSINRLVEISRQADIKNVIFSPGSRNAPLVIAFHAANCFDIRTIPDERVAGFFALGQGIASRVPSIICCTSGSAVLNYAPAIVEAYYQRVPMLILTADRPSRLIDQGIGQSMRQKEVYSNYIKQSYSWVEEAVSESDLKSNDELISQAIIAATSYPQGPVHINIPFEEPLYDKVEYQRPQVEFHSPKLTKPEVGLSPDLASLWQSKKKKIILCGLMSPYNQETSAALISLSERGDVVLMTESTSNVSCSNSIQCLDRVLHSDIEESLLQCDLLVSIGDKPLTHWYIDGGSLKDTYQSQPVHIPRHPSEVLGQLVDLESPNDGAFQAGWVAAQTTTSHKHDLYIASAPYSDLTVINKVIAELPSDIDLHLANSTPVRYLQLFDQSKELRSYSNRGVSGIDGSTSTALGFSSLADKNNVLITGDLSFIYDSNAFWQERLPQLLVILINNGGRGIFRYIPGPETTEQLESVFEAHHNRKADNICQMYDLNYTAVYNLKELSQAISSYNWDDEQCSVIEIFTPRLTNARILRSYFESMKV